MDFAGPFLGHMFLVTVDSHTKLLEVFQMQNITSRKTIERLRSCFATHGLDNCLCAWVESCHVQNCKRKRNINLAIPDPYYYGFVFHSYLALTIPIRSVLG